MINNLTFKLRASQAGALMTNPRSKSETMSKTAMTAVEDWLKEKLYDVRKQITTPAIEKGIELEDLAIEKAIEWLNLPFCMKNEEHFEDEFFTGTPDIILNDRVIDIKNSWDYNTFPLFEHELPTKGYYYQVQVYMHLIGLKSAEVVYVLLDTPETFSNNAISYAHVDPHLRIKSYKVNYDPEPIKELQNSVTIARTYANELLSTLK